MRDIPNADAYGVVLFNARGQVLLREPGGHFGGYVWTFAKGRPDPGEAPAQTAMRVALEETGYHVELLDVIPEAFAGTTGSSAFFIAGPAGSPKRPGKETAATRWVDLDEAGDLIARTKTRIGRERDRAILEAGVRIHASLPWEHRPATCNEDWPTTVFPEKHVEVPLDLFFDAEAMTQIRKGFLPMAMEDRWFASFEEPVLSLHRSWTGFCIYRVHFTESGQGWRARSAFVNRAPDQYGETDVELDRKQIAELIAVLLVGAREGRSIGAPGGIRPDGANGRRP